MGNLSVVALCAFVAVAALPAMAFGQAPPDSRYVTPTHLDVGDQVFEASVSGFRTYLETKRASDPHLFAELDPKVAHLESRVAAARVVAVAGLVGGLALGGYAIFGRRTCTQPSVSDPNFAADTAAWGACNDDNVRIMGTFGLIGIGVMSLGGFGWWLITPKRSDLFDLVNARNALSHDTMRLQIGFDSTGRLAMGGLSATF